MSTYTEKHLDGLGITKLKAIVKKASLKVVGVSKYKKEDEGKLRGIIKRELQAKGRLSHSKSPKKRSPSKKKRSPKKRSPSKKRSKSPHRSHRGSPGSHAALLAQFGYMKNLGITKLKDIAKKIGIKGYSAYKSDRINHLLLEILHKLGYTKH